MWLRGVMPDIVHHQVPVQVPEHCAAVHNNTQTAAQLQSAVQHIA